MLASFVKVGGRKFRKEYNKDAVETKIAEIRVKMQTFERRDFDMLESAESSAESTLASAGRSIKEGLTQGFHHLGNAGRAVHRTFVEPIVGFGSRMMTPMSQPSPVFQPSPAFQQAPMFQPTPASPHTPVFQSAPIFEATPVFQPAPGGAPELQVIQMPQQQQRMKLSDLPQPVASRPEKGGFKMPPIRTMPPKPRQTPRNMYPKEKLDDIYEKEELDDDMEFGGSSKTRKRRHNKKTHRVKPRKLMSRRQKYSRRK
jgi:hypothetical protein